MKFRRWDIDLGVAAAWKLPTDPESGMYGKNIQNLYPDVRIAFKGIRSFDMYFELGGGAVMNTYSSLLASDRRFGMLYGRGQGALLEMTDEEIGKCIIPMEDTLIFLGTVQLDDNRFTAFINGNPSGTGYRVTGGSQFTAGDGDKYHGCSIYKVYSGGIFLGTGYIKGRDLIPAKVIYR
jgi:hypothetical protein